MRGSDAKTKPGTGKFGWTGINKEEKHYENGFPNERAVVEMTGHPREKGKLVLPRTSGEVARPNCTMIVGGRNRSMWKIRIRETKRRRDATRL